MISVLEGFEKSSQPSGSPLAVVFQEPAEPFLAGFQTFAKADNSPRQNYAVIRALSDQRN